MFRACISVGEREKRGGKWDVDLFYLCCYWFLKFFHLHPVLHIHLGWNSSLNSKFKKKNLNLLFLDWRPAQWLDKTTKTTKLGLLPCETEDEIRLSLTYTTRKIFHPASCNNYIWDRLDSSVLKSKSFSFSKPKSMAVTFILFTCFQQSHYSRYCLRILKNPDCWCKD